MHHNRRRLTPPELVAELDRTIVGAEDAKVAVATTLCWNQQRRDHIDRGADPRYLLPRYAAMLIGPSGSGKTLIAETAAQILGVPFLSTTATLYVSAGYKGRHVEDMLDFLVEKAGGNIELAEWGVIFVDEVCKLAGHDTDEPDVSGYGAQEALLKPLQGAEMAVSRGMFRTDHLTWVAAGVFRELSWGKNVPVSQLPAEAFEEAGFLAEFMGRWTHKAEVPLPGEGEFFQLLKEGEESPLRRLQYTLGRDGVTVEATHDWVRWVVDAALSRGTGYRALHSVVGAVHSRLFMQLSELKKAGGVVLLPGGKFQIVTRKRPVAPSGGEAEGPEGPPTPATPQPSPPPRRRPPPSRSRPEGPAGKSPTPPGEKARDAPPRPAPTRRATDVPSPLPPPPPPEPAKADQQRPEVVKQPFVIWAAAEQAQVLVFLVFVSLALFLWMFFG